MLKILIYLGSAREGNNTQHVAQLIQSVTESRDDVQAEIIDPIALKLDIAKEANGDAYPELKKKAAEADGYILVSPEYNHGYSGSLKYMLDLNLKEYIHKPVAIVGVSAGPFGGARVIEALVNVVRELGMVVTFTDLNISYVQNELENGEFKDKEIWTDRANKMIDELVWMGETLKKGRAR